ncbi:MAG TPA: sulfotransferase [Fimbriimonadaceae bacterium]|jgi:tetratricopeptide (TPR) repeat protein
MEQGAPGMSSLTEEAIRRSLKQDPRRLELHLALGFNLQEQGRFADAERSFLEAISIQPSQGNAYYGLAQGRKFTADDLPLVERMNALPSGHLLPEQERQQLCYALGKVYDDLGEYEKALHFVDQANALASNRRRTARGPFDQGKYRAQIDRTMQLFSENFFRKYGNLGNTSRMPILVLGMMRSGTTLLEQILASHPEIGAGGELMFWLQNARKTLAGDDTPHIERLSMVCLGYQNALREVAPGKPKVVDKMPANYLMLGAIHLAFPQARIIHCRRNPVDTCLSIYMQSYSVSPDFAHDRGNIVFMYQQYLRLMDHWRRIIPENVMLEVSYEDLVLDREAQTRRMIDFCGLDWSAECLHHEKNRGSIKTSSVWQARQPIYKTSVERWRNYEPWLGEFRELL